MEPINPMETPAFELLAPLRLNLSVASSDQPGAVVDVLEANDAIAAASDRAKGLPNSTAWLVELRPWLAERLGVPVESLALNQVFEFSEAISAVVEADTAARKKKLGTIAFWQQPTPASPEISEDGTNEKNALGSPTLNAPALGSSESTPA